MKNALIAALVAAVVSSAAANAAGVRLSLVDRSQNARITKLERHEVRLKARAQTLEWETASLRWTMNGPPGGAAGLVVQMQSLYQQLHGCHGAKTPVVIRSDGTLAAPADGETPTAFLVTRDATRCFDGG